jgi:hypothetical protein
MVLAPTWPETGAGSSYTPSPMTLSRWDYASDRLWEGGDHRTAYPRSFFHPGVGMWQLDSAGLGSALPTWRAISSYYAAKLVAQRMASAYCSSSGSESQRRAAAWRPWRACADGACESIYQAIDEPDRVVVTGTDRLGAKAAWLPGPADTRGILRPSLAGSSIRPQLKDTSHPGSKPPKWELRGRSVAIVLRLLHVRVRPAGA